MCKIYRYKENQPVVWYHRQHSKSNQYCLYCGAFVGGKEGKESNKEHLVGREFVPTGALDGGGKFNFIFRACKECNAEKSNIERHISTVSLFNSPARRDSEHYNIIANRKASKDYHPDKKGTLVKDSTDNHVILFELNPNVKLSFNIETPPQPSAYFLKLLAFRHIQGIFSLITTQNALDAQKTKLLPGEHFYFFGAFFKTDWGNPQILSAIEKSKSFPCYANIDTADGFFKAIMRRENGKYGEWFWALEWNKSIRVFGGIFDPDKVPKAFRDLPTIDWYANTARNYSSFRFREETLLNESEDCLFQK